MDADIDELHVPQKPDLEALKAAVAETKAVHREAVKAIVEAKRVGDAAHRRFLAAFRAYNEARPPSARPRPERAPRPDAGDVFAPST